MFCYDVLKIKVVEEYSGSIVVVRGLSCDLFFGLFLLFLVL